MSQYIQNPQLILGLRILGAQYKHSSCTWIIWECGCSGSPKMRSQLFLVDKSKIRNRFWQFYFKLKIKCFHSLFVLHHSAWEPSHKSGPYIIQYIQAKNKRSSLSQRSYRFTIKLRIRNKIKVTGCYEIQSISIVST